MECVNKEEEEEDGIEGQDRSALIEEEDGSEGLECVSKEEEEEDGIEGQDRSALIEEEDGSEGRIGAL